ncbi:pentatricopeptide repeat-containing protein At2g13600-like [Daucus carota subsp. sativus]
MISSFQQHGCAHQAIELFKNMLEEGIKPSYITFVSVLSACSHTGRVDEGFYYFNAMSEQHNINPGHEHYACMVDLLSRAGRLGEAKNFVDSMPIKPGASVWGALLGACNRFGNLEMGVEVAERLFVIEPHNPGNYVLLSNIYTCKGRLKEASEVRRLMRLNQVSKKTGYSWIDSNNQDARLYK